MIIVASCVSSIGFTFIYSDTLFSQLLFISPPLPSITAQSKRIFLPPSPSAYSTTNCTVSTIAVLPGELLVAILVEKSASFGIVEIAQIHLNLLFHL